MHIYRVRYMRYIYICLYPLVALSRFLHNGIEANVQFTVSVLQRHVDLSKVKIILRTSFPITFRQEHALALAMETKTFKLKKKKRIQKRGSHLIEPIGANEFLKFGNSSQCCRIERKGGTSISHFETTKRTDAIFPCGQYTYIYYGCVCNILPV